MSATPGPGSPRRPRAGGLELATRSQWYLAMQRCAAGRGMPKTHGAMLLVRRLVDFHYNLQVDASVRAGGTSGNELEEIMR